MATPARESEDRRRRILEAAVRVFARDGRHGARVQDIADEAEVAYGLVYHYFGTKDALLQSIYDDNWEVFAEAVEGIAASARAPEAKLHAVIDYALGALEAYPDRVRIIILEYGRSAGLTGPLDHPQVARAIGGVRSILVDLAAAGRLASGADPAVLALLWMGTLEAAVSTTAMSSARRPTFAAIRQTVHALVDGVIPPASRSPEEP